jgi:hypothetical protein
LGLRLLPRYFAYVAFEEFRAADWRLRLYTLLVLAYWTLALGPGGGGTAEVSVDWDGAIINLLLLIPLWRGSKWAVTLLALMAMASAIVIATAGIPPWDPMFGSLALVAAIQFLLLVTYDLGPNSDSEDVGGRTPAPVGQTS